MRAAIYDHFIVRRIKCTAVITGLKRQTFFVNYGGWDHHDEVIDTQARMRDVVSRCLGSFYAAREANRLSFTQAPGVDPLPFRKIS